MAISNLLRVYSETLANQRQQRFAEMQLSLQALQFTKIWFKIFLSKTYFFSILFQII